MIFIINNLLRVNFYKKIKKINLFYYKMKRRKKLKKIKKNDKKSKKLQKNNKKNEKIDHFSKEKEQNKIYYNKIMMNFNMKRDWLKN